MSRIVSQSIFTAETAPVRSWQSYATSGAVHVGIVALLFLITFPAVKEAVRPTEHVTLISPVLPAYSLRFPVPSSSIL